MSKARKGSALVSALFIMTLIAIAATAMSTRLQLDIYRTRMIIDSDKLYYAAQLVSFWSLNELSSKTQLHYAVDGKILDLPKPLQTLYPNFLIKGSLYDLQGRFNLNNLSDKKYYAMFLNLLENALPEVDAKERDAIATAARQWISPYELGRGNDEMMSYYLAQTPAYYPSQQLFQNVSEFRLLRGVDAKIYRALAPYITVLPEVTPININTAAKPVLMSLGNGLNESQVGELITARGKKGFANIKAVNELLKKLNIREEQVSLESQYFKSIATVIGPDFNLSNTVIICRKMEKKGKLNIRIVEESLNS